MNLGFNLGLGGARGGASQTVEEQLVAALTGAGVSSVHNLALATPGATWRSDDLTTNNNDFTQTTAASQPAVVAEGATFDSGDWISQTLSGQSLDVVMSFTKSDASTSGTVVSDSGATQIFIYASGDGGTFPSGTWAVNGASVTTRAGAYTALHTVGKALIVGQNASMATRTFVRIGRGSGTSLVGTVARVVILDRTALGAGLDSARSLAETWVMQ